jgi:F-type H+-transporting ATPase subunit delta
MSASVGSTYARAFADVVVNARLDAAQAVAELKAVSTMIHESSELGRVWENPGIPAPQKRALLDAIAGQASISRPVRNLMAVLIDHRRTQYLDSVVKQLEKDLNDRMGFAEADVSSARELGASEKQALEAQVAKMTGRKVKANYAQDASLLGGAVVRVGSTIYDGSVKGRLAKIREAMSS